MWHDEELQELLRRQDDTQKESELRTIMKQIKKKKVELLNKFYEQKAQNINEASEARKIDREFAEAKKHHMRKESRDLLVSKSALHCHFESHFKDNDIVPMPPEITNPKDSCLMDTLNTAIEVDESPPTEKEVEGVLAQLKNGKCSGIDNIRMEQMKFGRRSNAFIQHLMKLLFLIWTSAIVPALWMQSKISCIFKKGSRSDAANYRGISVTATLSRLLPMIILDRIAEAYNKTLDQTQFGFRRNKGCDNAIFVLRNVINRSPETMYISFIDLTAAYDKIPRNLLFRVLDIRLGCRHLVSLLKEIYTNTSARISGLKKFFFVKAGCRQGGIESPIIFNIYFDTVCKVLDYELKKTLGDGYGIEIRYRITNEATSRTQRTKHPSNGVTKLLRALYADDMYTIFRNRATLQKGMIMVEEVFTRYGLTLSRKKTETMVVNGPEEDTTSESIITLGTSKIKNVQQFKYLGVQISPNSNIVMIQHRIASATAKFAELKDMFKNHRINIKIRVKFLMAFVRSRLTYNCCTLFNASKDIKKLEVEWTRLLRLLRRLVRNGMKRRAAPPPNISQEEKEQGNWDYSYVYTNTDIHRICRTSTIEEFVTIQHLKWIAHVVRMENGTLEKQTLFMEGKDVWKGLEKTIGMDRMQLRRTMFNKKDFDCLFEGSQGASQT